MYVLHTSFHHVQQKPSGHIIYLKKFLFRALNRIEEVSLVLYSVACRKQPSERIMFLKKCLNLCTGISSLEAFSKSVNEYIDLLERQIIIEVNNLMIVSYLV